MVTLSTQSALSRTLALIIRRTPRPVPLSFFSMIIFFFSSKLIMSHSDPLPLSLNKEQTLIVFNWYQVYFRVSIDGVVEYMWIILLVTNKPKKGHELSKHNTVHCALPTIQPTQQLTSIKPGAPVVLLIICSQSPPCIVALFAAPLLAAGTSDCYRCFGSDLFVTVDAPLQKVARFTCCCSVIIVLVIARSLVLCGCSAALMNFIDNI